MLCVFCLSASREKISYIRTNLINLKTVLANCCGKRSKTLEDVQLEKKHTVPVADYCPITTCPVAFYSLHNVPAVQ